MKENVIKANRKRDLWLADKDAETGDIDNAYYIPKGWCDEFTYAKGFAAGPDWLEHLPDSGLDDAPSLFCYAPWFTQPNSEVGTLFVDVVNLQEFDEVSREEALAAHPAMGEYLDRINNEGRDKGDTAEKPIRVIVEVQGGRVNSVWASVSENISVNVLDLDDMEDQSSPESDRKIMAKLREEMLTLHTVY